MTFELHFFFFFVVIYLGAAQRQNYSLSRNASCKTGADLVRALADPAIEAAYLERDISLTEDDWAGHNSGLILERSFTLASPASRPVILNLGFLRSKLRVSANRTLTFQNLVLVHFRSGSSFQAPGLDLLSSLPSGEQAFLHFKDGYLLSPFCFPISVAREALATVKRPLQYGGENVVQLPGPLPLPPSKCSNDTEAYMLERCFVYTGLYVDFAFYGADVQQPGDISKPSGYLIRFQNFSYLCPWVLADDCILKYNPLGCVRYTLFAQANASANRSVSGSGGVRRKQVTISLTCTLGGATVLIMALAVGFLVRKRARQQREQEQQRQQGILAGSALPQDRSCCAAMSLPAVNGVVRGAAEEKGASDFEDSGRGSRATSPQHVGSSNNKPSDTATAVAGAVGIATDATDAADDRRGLPAALAPSATAVATAAAVAAPLTGDEGGLATGDLAGEAADLTAPYAVELKPRVLGKGATGRVYEGTYRGRPVAVKVVLGGGGGGGGNGMNINAAAAARRPRQRQRTTAQAQVGVSMVSCGTSASSAARSNSCLSAFRFLSFPSQLQGRVPTEALPVDVQPGAAADTRPDNVQQQQNQQQQNQRQQQQQDTNTSCVKVILNLEDLAGSRVTMPAALESFPGFAPTNAAASSSLPPAVALLMETSLEHLIYGSGARTLIPLAKVLHIAAEVCSGLEYLHPTVTHRDLKPANVLLNNAYSATPEVKLILDSRAFKLLHSPPSILGRARVLRPGQQAHHTSCGHVLAGGAVVGNVDWAAALERRYGLGGGLRCGLAGYPIVAVGYKVTVLKERLPLEQLSNRRCPPKLKQLVRRCWEEDPRRRPAAAEAAKELRALRQQVLGGGSSGSMLGRSILDGFPWLRRSLPHAINSPQRVLASYRPGAIGVPAQPAPHWGDVCASVDPCLMPGTVTLGAFEGRTRGSTQANATPQVAAQPLLAGNHQGGFVSGGPLGITSDLTAAFGAPSVPYPWAVAVAEPAVAGVDVEAAMVEGLSAGRQLSQQQQQQQQQQPWGRQPEVEAAGSESNSESLSEETLKTLMKGIELEMD
ncbi:hypothetical protein VOLCADRAFT_85883 [Volvox carteri f. nagariensis]|uniref:Protein kinase domain-containing protein n=1 Tax=Volvox carteri f. nagariensis TaxID=3068 RepID=D8TH89_VOLCA|nr:uncharacterized protein VOLCADRAFT_85883 [Volvox carteri f. nagariensis]EFJ52670.1 hypothetical protein VOLCADRAFT_85883 [Volvox carteri f. nagariensis]|eukprot:XP_002945675.1 hypothetical protein VOLCADRAFT_85883 [Volvox carteri f. nagariensis]